MRGGDGEGSWWWAGKLVVGMGEEVEGSVGVGDVCVYDLLDKAQGVVLATGSLRIIDEE